MKFYFLIALLLLIAPIAPLIAQTAATTDVKTNIAPLQSNPTDPEEQLYRNNLSTSSNGTAWARLAGVCYRLGRYNEALTDYRNALRLAPLHAGYHYSIGSCYYGLRRYSEAANEFLEFARAEPRSPSGHYGAAIAYQNLRRTDEAEKEFETAVNLDPHWTEAAFKQTLLANPKDFEAHLWRGFAFMRLQQFNKSMGELELAKRISPDNARLKKFLLINYLSLSRFDEASRMYPVLFTVVGGALLACFMAGLGLLLTKSFTVTGAQAPGILFASAWVLIYMLSQTVFILLIGLVHPSGDMANFSVGGMVGTIPVLVGLWAFRRQGWGAPFQWAARIPWKQLFLAIAGIIPVLFLNGIYVGLYTLVTGHSPEQERSLHLVGGMMQTHPTMAVAFVVVLGPIVEETLFRGLLFGALQKRLGLWTIPVTAAVFGAFHLDPAYFIPLTVLGLLFGWARWKSGAIWLSVILHTIVNGLAMAVLWLAPQAIH